ncbi:MAG TPA: YMGG-like glycine zipper-containing protein [Pyrinomonadaceae bacterium]|nr:YMGG-like glycine zipper-containing protein [Pyrinomonadaceae bacterium]
MRVRKILTTFFALTLIAAGITLVQAQRQSYRGTYRSVQQLITRLDNRTDLLRTSLNAQSQRRAYGTSGRDAEALLNDLDLAVETLQQRFNARNSTAADAENVLRHAALIEPLMGNEVRGSGVLRHWNPLRADLNHLATAYGISWPTVSQSFPATGSGYGQNMLTGTYRLNTSRSDDPTRAADDAIRSMPYRDRQRFRDQIVARLESPDQMAIELRGREVTLASSRAPQISFVADGVERVESSTTGRPLRARATVTGDQLIVSSTGEAGNQFNVTFDPIDNGRAMQVTRRVYVTGLSRAVEVRSIYDKTSAVARFDINTGPQTYPTDSTAGFIVPNGEKLVAVINNNLSTETARQGDRFTAMIRQPAQYEGATIEGHVSNVQRSGRVTGRSELTLSFDTIRLRDGRSYRFAGILEGVRSARGERVAIDNEGAVRDDSQTDRTVQRAAIGTAVGAIIGAIAGGGKGAAIGAILGAGGGAGSVYVQGREDLVLEPGTELSIRSTGPQ